MSKPFLTPLRFSPLRPRRRSWWRWMMGRREGTAFDFVLALHIMRADWKERSALR